MCLEFSEVKHQFLVSKYAKINVSANEGKEIVGFVY